MQISTTDRRNARLPRLLLPLLALCVVWCLTTACASYKMMAAMEGGDAMEMTAEANALNETAPATPPGAAGEAGAPFVQPRPGRKVVYTGQLQLEVPNKRTAQETIEQIVKRYDGFIQSSTLDAITFRVTPEKFDAAYDEVKALGAVLQSKKNSQDVTDQYADLELRIEVAEGSRKRLMAILERAGELKDILEVERDIRRLTEELEKLKGTLRVLSHQVAYSTISVALQQQTPHQPRRLRRLDVRFGWVHWVGVDKALAPVSTSARLRPWWTLWSLAGRPFTLETEAGTVAPKDFAPLLYDGEELIAATAEDYRLRVRRVKPRQAEDLDFWAKSLKLEFERNRGYRVEAPEEFELKSKKLEARVLRCTSSFGGESLVYDVWLVKKKGGSRQMAVVEFVRPATAKDAHLEEVESAVRGIKLRPSMF